MAEQRLIQYGDRKMEMEPGMTLDQAKELMARHFPELADPKVETKKTDDKTTYIFSKKAGHKGRGRRRARLSKVVRQLAAVPASTIDGPIFTYVRNRQARRDTRADYVNAGHLANELREEAERVARIRGRLLDLPSAGAPAGSIL